MSPRQTSQRQASQRRHLKILPRSYINISSMILTLQFLLYLLLPLLLVLRVVLLVILWSFKHCMTTNCVLDARKIARVIFPNLHSSGVAVSSLMQTRMVFFVAIAQRATSAVAFLMIIHVIILKPTTRPSFVSAAVVIKTSTSRKRIPTLVRYLPFVSNAEQLHSPFTSKCDLVC